MRPTYQGPEADVRSRAHEQERTLSNITQDFLYAVRQLRRHPRFALATVLVLGLGVGASAAVFSVVDAVLFRALPFANAERVVQVFAEVPNLGTSRATLPGFRDWEREAGPFESLGAFHPTVHSLTGEATPQRIIVGSTAGDYFGTVGLTATIGRLYGDDERVGGRNYSEPVMVLSESLFRESFGADPEVIGQTVEVDGQPTRILGVLPPEEQLLRFGSAVDAWAPMGEPLFWMGRGTGFLRVLGRLRPGLTPEAAEQPLQALATGLIEAGNTESGISMVSLQDVLIGDARPLLWALQGASLLLLLVVATNGANLLLARSLDRSGEFAVRAALGASRRRVVRQVLVDTSLLGLLSGVAGLGLALVFRSLVLNSVPELAALAGSSPLNWTVLAYTFGTALAVGVLAGIWPAARATSSSWAGMKVGSGRGGSGRAQRGRRVMVAVEVGLALVLLVTAGLMVRTVYGLLDEDLGFESQGVLTARVTLPESQYPEATDRVRFFDSLVERLESLPGAEEVGLTSALPLSGRNDTGTFEIDGKEWEDGDGPSIGKRSASAGYFAALGIPVLAGREFATRDHAEALPVTVISESAARRFFPGEDPVGKRINIGWWGSDLMEVVGVVGDVKQSSLDEGPEAAAYRPQAQIGAPDATIVIRTTGDPYGLVTSVRSAVLDADPNLPTYEVIALDDLVRGSASRQSALMSLLLGLSIAALVISCLGVYAVTAQAVRRSGREIGIRLALGARGSDVLKSVMAAESKVIGLGILMGLVGALVVTRLLGALLYGVSPFDLPTVAASVAVLGGVALLSALGPAVRASRIDPARTLRSD